MTPADYRDGRAWDLAAAIPLMALCLLASSGFAIMIVHEWPSLHDGATLLVVASQVCSTVFLLFQAGLLLVRRLPIAKAQGSAPRIWAVIGANFAFLMLLVPKAAPTPLMASVSSVLVLMGTACSIYTLGWLGKSFAVFPQARQLVTQGPYRFVRHPLYLAEQVSAFGLALQYRQPWSLLIVSAGLLFQLPRMHFEEKVLEATYAPYRDYRRRTARLIPFLY
jgi:protein-S-isoprenylcysteine O-methyltransferase Ste14